MQPSLLRNYNDGIHLNVNEVEPSNENVPKVNENDTNSNEKNLLCSKENHTLQQVSKDSYLKHLELPDGCNREDRNFIENGVEVSDISYLMTQDCFSNECLSGSASEIENDTRDCQDSCCFLKVNSSDDVTKCKVVDKSDSVSDVKSFSETVSESQLVNDITMMLPSNLPYDNTELIGNSHEKENTDVDETNCDNFQELEGIKWDLPVLELLEASALQPENTEPASQISEQAFSPAIDCFDEQKPITTIEADIVRPSSSTETSNVNSKLDVDSSEELEQSSQNISNLDSTVQENSESSGCDQNVPPPIENILPDLESVSDDDSGVSSEEGNNSPLFFFNNQMLNYNDDVQDEDNLEAKALVNIDSSTCDNREDFTAQLTSDISNSDLKPDLETTENFECILGDKSLGAINVSEDLAVSQSPNKFTGARPKLDGQISQNSVPGACIDESEKQNDLDSKNMESITCSELDSQYNKIDVISETSQVDDCDISEKSDVVPPCDSCNIEDDSLCNIDNIEIECDNEVSVNTISASTEKESSIITSDMKNDNLQQRLSRPTTLDLPSRHAAISHTSAETGVNLNESNLQSTPTIDLVPSETLVNDNACGM